jgi:lipoate-protein ligase A
MLKRGGLILRIMASEFAAGLCGASMLRQRRLHNTNFGIANMAPSRGLGMSHAQRVFSEPVYATRRSSLSLSMGRTAASLNDTLLLRARRPWSSQTCAATSGTTHGICRNYSSFTENLADPAHRLQSYVSHSSDPYLNLSIEDHILRKSPADSTILFLYVNRPCVVIGRNQNPWTEVNLGILNAVRGAHAPKDSEPPGIGTVDLVRRRSGGGTVFHDEGNLNWSITCPRGAFTRDKHAEMVVRALRQLGIERARVNERHDIVLDQGHERRASEAEDTHRTPYTIADGTLPRPLKVSGSAYKLTRLRALHHATTLLSSPNLHIIPQYLRSPAKQLIQAQGVESVSSPVANIGLDVEPFQQRLQEEFATLYKALGTPSIVETVGDEYLSIPDIRKGYDELQVSPRLGPSSLLWC